MAGYYRTIAVKKGDVFEGGIFLSEDEDKAIEYARSEWEALTEYDRSHTSDFYLAKYDTFSDALDASYDHDIVIDFKEG